MDDTIAFLKSMSETQRNALFNGALSRLEHSLSSTEQLSLMRIRMDKIKDLIYELENDIKRLEVINRHRAIQKGE